MLKFEISAQGTILADANSNRMSVESFKRKERKAWRGKCLVIMKSDNREGQIVLKANADGLAQSEKTITTKL